MLARDVEIVDLDPFQLENAFNACSEGGAIEAPPMLIVFYRDNNVVHAVHSQKGPLPAIRFHGPGGMEAMAEEHGVKRVVCLETGALRRLVHNAQSRLDFKQTFWEQMLACRAAVKGELRSGIHIYPDPFKAIPVIPEFMNPVLKWLLPRSFLFVLGVYEGDSVWTSLIVGVENWEIKLVTTTDSLGTIDTGDPELSGKAARVNEEVGLRWSAPTVGVHMERGAFEQILRHPSPISTFFRLVQRKWILVSPLPPRLKVLMPLGRFLKN